MSTVGQRIANMSVVCACIVALSHVGYNTAVGSAGWWFVRMTRCGVCCLAVPFFFAVSGYFLSRHFEEPGWWTRETSKRVKSLLVPYLLWCIAFFVFARVGAAAAKASSAKGFFDALKFPLSQLALAAGLRLDATPMLVPTWYMRALLVIVLVSPAIAWLFRSRYAAAFSTAAAFCAYVALSPHRNGLSSTRLEHFFYYGVSLMGLAYFQLGVVMRRTRFLERTLNASPWIGVVLLSLGLAVVAFRVQCIAANGGEPFPMLCAAIPLLVAGLWMLVPSAPWPKWLTSMSFPVYVMHFFVVYAMDGFRRAKADKSIAVMLLQAAVAVVVPCLVALLLRRLAPKAASAVFGGR